jgi:hypothetical protein
MLGGVDVELHAGPVSPAAATGRIPAARKASTALRRLRGAQLSVKGHVKGIRTMSGASDGMPRAL